MIIVSVKKEKYFGFKVHVVTNLDDNLYNYVVVSANVDERKLVLSYPI